MGLMLFVSLLLVCGFIARPLPLLSGKSVSACPVLFLLFPVYQQVLYSICLLQALIGGCLRSVSSFFSACNHFVLSLSIISRFSMLLLALFHTFKLDFLPAS